MKQLAHFPPLPRIASWQELSMIANAKILLSGASGMLGAALERAALAHRMQVIQLFRGKKVNPDQMYWNPSAPQPVADLAGLEGIGAAIHLSGASLSSHRWTPAYKQQILSSRVDTTRALVKAFSQLKQPPHTLLCASATGIYGDRAGEILTDASTPGRGFLAETCLAWEAEADRAREQGIRVVHLRFGVVLAPHGGALKQMLPLFRLGLGGNLGSGQQWMSWIALPDLVSAVFHLLKEETLQGPVNLVGPSPVTNADFTRALGHALHRPAILPAPAFALRAAFGEMADAALLASTRAIPQRLLATGFHFDLPEIGPALATLLSHRPDSGR